MKRRNERKNEGRVEKRREMGKDEEKEGRYERRREMKEGR